MQGLKPKPMALFGISLLDLLKEHRSTGVVQDRLIAEDFGDCEGCVVGDRHDGLLKIAPK